MFWKFNLMTTNIDTLLDKEDITLHELLDEDEVLQECKAQNRRLVDFLVRPENMAELVSLITKEPDEDTDEKVKYKYPNSACELLTSDVAQITSILAGEEGGEDGLITDIYAFMEKDDPLNPLLASFFSKVMGLLIGRKSSKMLDFLQSKEDFVGQLLHHLGTSAIMDLLLRLITCIESPECRTACMNWLNEQRLIQKLVGMIDPAHSEEKHCNASQTLCDIIRLSREQMSQLQEKADTDPLLAAIESEETIAELLNHMLTGEPCESVLVGGLSVIQTLLEFRKIGAEGGQEQMTPLDAERLAVGVSSTLLALTPRLKDLHHLLLHPPKQHYSNMPTSLGPLEPPLGNTRLQIARLVSTLLVTNTHSVNAELASLGTVAVLLDLYFKYSWNNFLHTHVEVCIATILNNPPADTPEKSINTSLLTQLLTDVNIIDRILEAWQENETQQSRPGGHRQGYMGHLTRTANHVADMEKGTNVEQIKELYKELPEETRTKWEAFTSGTLAETNKQNTVELVSMVSSQALHSSSEDDDPDFRDIPFPQDSAMQQAFSDYQLQQMTSNFIDQFGFNEDEFTEPEERVDAPFNDRISAISFDIINITEGNANAVTLFEQACNDRMQQFEEADSDEDLWEEKELTFPQSSDSQQSLQPSKVLPGKTSGKEDVGEQDDSGGSSDSEEDLPSPSTIVQSGSEGNPEATSTTSSTTTTTSISSTNTEKMEVDSSENWASFESSPPPAPSATPIAMDVASGWASEVEKQSKSGNWAKFDEATVNSTSGAESEEGWADFTSFQTMDSSSNSLSVTNPNPRSSSPVDMDTNDSVPSNSRTAAYLVGSAPADLATEVAEAKSSTDVDDASSSIPPDTSTLQKLEIASQSADSTTSTSPVSLPATTTTTTTTENTTTTSQPQTQGVGANEDLNVVPDSTNGVTGDTSSVNMSNNEGHQPEGSDKAVSHSQPTPATPPLEADDDDDDLSDNFNFLASSGLMRTNTQDPDTPSHDAKAASCIQQSQPDTKNIETIRAQAQEALSEFSDATTPSSTQNGPV